MDRGWNRGLAGDGCHNGRPYYLALKAEALYLARRTSEALEAINEAEAVAERREKRWWSAELHRLRGMFLAAMGAEETQIEASFCEAIRSAKQQKSISLEKRAEATSYRRGVSTSAKAWPHSTGNEFIASAFWTETYVKVSWLRSQRIL